MDLGGLRDLVLERNLSFQGVDITVRLPFAASVASTGIWRSSLLEDVPEGDDMNRRSPRRAMALPLAEFPSVPIGTTITAPEKPGGTATNWKVDGYIEVEDNHITVALIPVVT